MELNYFDIVAGVIILLLGLKGIINGFFKEVFGLIGIIGGIFIASRIGDDVGQYLSDMIFKFTNPSAISFTGFLVSLALFWVLMILTGMVFHKLSRLSGLGGLDKILGFLFGASKFFLIGAVIAFAISNIKSLKPTLDSVMSNSILYPVFVSTGSFIMKIDPVEEVAQVQENIDAVTQTVEETAQEMIQDSIEKNISEINATIETNLTNETNLTKEN
ncbi:CvpA family protein [Sulfurimonas marina]|uniref:CvpA family protein n=1 Tax=Sulfurimonas marina TaxID=2590551 RepID=A0A7M1AYW8_9BACT|nr:CvpA family protein [Sulfurimonas marina]QOP41572.1 CvpA family protein [Sulfurimonas marina]